MTDLDRLDTWLTNKIGALEWDFEEGETSPGSHSYTEAPDRETLIERLDIYRTVQEELHKVKTPHDTNQERN